MIDKEHFQYLKDQALYDEAENYIINDLDLISTDGAYNHEHALLLLDFLKEQKKYDIAYQYIQVFFPKPRSNVVILYATDILLNLHDYDIAHQEIKPLLQQNTEHNNISFHYCLARIMLGLGNIDALEQHCNEMIRIDANFSKPYDWLSCIYRQQERFTEANALLEKMRIQAILPAHYINHQYALNYLQQGYYKEGLAVYGNDSVIQLKEIMDAAMAPTWQGTPLEANESLTILCIYGLGDLFFFTRYLRQAIKAAKQKSAQTSVIALCWPSVVCILEELQLFDAIYAIDTQSTYPITNYTIPLFQLPSALSLDRGDSGEKPPYITVPANMKKKWQKKIRNNNKKKIGFCFAARIEERSIDISAIAALWQNTTLSDNFDFYLLVKDSDYMAYAPTQTHDFIIDYGQELDSLWDTAALIDEMDIIISVDTLQANIAGVLHKKTFVLSNYFLEFRWNQPKQYTPFYPSVTPIVMAKKETWSDVIKHTITLLEEEAQQI